MICFLVRYVETTFGCESRFPTLREEQGSRALTAEYLGEFPGIRR
jgi:hypothetical protein